MKYLSIIFSFLFLFACESDGTRPDAGAPLTPGDLDAIEAGEIIAVEEPGFEWFPLLNVNVETYPLVECPPAPYDPELYWWLCRSRGTNGRAIAIDDGDPSADDFGVYMECPSVNYSCDMTFSLYFNKIYWPLYADSDLSFGDVRGQVASWGDPFWNLARLEYCANNPDDCNQEE